MITISSTGPKQPIPPLLKVRDVAKLLCVCPTTVHRLIQSGDLDGSNVNPSKNRRPHLRITRRSLFGFYKKRFGHHLNRALENPFES